MAVGEPPAAVHHHPGTLAGAAAASALWAPAWLEMWRVGLDVFWGDKTRKMLQIREDFAGFFMFLCVFWVEIQLDSLFQML